MEVGTATKHLNQTTGTMRRFTTLYMCLLLFIVQSTSGQTIPVSSGTVPSHNSSEITTHSIINNTSSTHNTSTTPNFQSQSSQSPSPHPTITQPQFTRPVVTTSTMAKPPLTPTPSPGSSNPPQGGASAHYVHFGLLLISLMFLVVVEL